MVTPKPDKEKATGIPIAEVDGINAKTVAILTEAEILTAEQVISTGKEKLLEIKGVGEATAEAVLKACQEAIETK